MLAINFNGLFLDFSAVQMQAFSNLRNEVAIYVKESLPEPAVRIKGNELELLALEFLPNHGKPFFVVAWYRPPTSSYLTPSSS